MYQPKPNDYYPPAVQVNVGPPPPMWSGPQTGIPVHSNQNYSAAPVGSRSKVKWSTGLCGCAEDCGSCCMTWWCPCVTFGRIAEIVDRGSTSCATTATFYLLLRYFTCFACLYSCSYRTKLRRQYNLMVRPCNDCLLHLCCEPCALCQEYRELKNRGFDMKIGWHGNMEREARGATLPPGIQGGMMR